MIEQIEVKNVATYDNQGVRIDLNNFKNVIDKLIYFFDWQWDMISQFEDMKAEMIADMYREYWH